MGGEEDDEEVDGVDQTDGATSSAVAASPPGGAASPKHTSRDESAGSEASQSGHQNRRKQLAKQGSVLSNYFGSGPRG